MKIQNVLIAAAMAAVTLGVYVAYWFAWRWGFGLLWPAGPDWLVRPEPVPFVVSYITGLIITLSILRTT